MIRNTLTIAGSDPSGGAGIQADIKAIAANGGYAMAALTALTAQNTVGVTGIEFIRPDFVAVQITAIREDIRIDAVKIGMLGNAETVAAVAGALRGLDTPIVLDPVMVAKAGDRLLLAEAVEALRVRLLPLAAVITPNLPEAADLLGTDHATSRSEMRMQAHALLASGCGAVYLKGGHLGGNDSPDLFVTPTSEVWFEGRRLPTRNTHGTGCTQSSAFATRLAQSADLQIAAAAARDYTLAAIATADQLNVGRGHGPLHHFSALWPPT